MLAVSIPVEKKRRGRPAGEKYPVTLPMRLTEEQSAEITVLAEREGITRSEAIRRLVEEALKAKRS